MPTAIALSGGGAKGDFQVGALRFLYDVGVRPDIVAGVSVGAINAARLASVAAPAGPAEKDAALRSLEQVWRSLREDSDMWLEEPWFTRLQRTVQDTVDFAVAGLNPFIPFQGSASCDARHWAAPVGPGRAGTGSQCRVAVQHQPDRCPAARPLAV